MDLIDSGLTQPSKLLLLAALLAKDNVISQNSKSFLKGVPFKTYAFIFECCTVLVIVTIMLCTTIHDLYFLCYI